MGCKGVYMASFIQRELKVHHKTKLKALPRCTKAGNMRAAGGEIVAKDTRANSFSYEKCDGSLMAMHRRQDLCIYSVL